MKDLATTVRDLAHQRPEATALLAPERAPMTYGLLWEELQRCAVALRAMGVVPATRVAVVLPNGPEMAVACLGAAACSTCAPLNPAYTAAEFRFYLQDTAAEIVIVQQADTGPVRAVATELGLRLVEIAIDRSAPAGCLGLPDHSGPPARFAAAHDVALILHTSGTTARPKIVPLTQSNLMASASSIATGLALVPGDRCLNVMPLFHIHGLVGALLASLTSGASIVCSPGFHDARFFEWVAQFQPTWYTAVPTIHQAIVAAGEQYRRKAPDHRFRFARSSSSALSPKTCQTLEALLGAPVIEAYGMTEASHQMTSNPLPPAVRKAGSVGRAAGAEIAIMNDAGDLLPAQAIGEIVIRGPGVTAGYANNPEANARAFTRGWFRTGDQGRLDADGYLTISGRLKEIVNRGGEKISPREVDEALLEHPDVAQATAFATPHPSLGEDLAAAVVLRAGAEPDEAALRAHLFARLAEFKVPSQLVFVPEIPKGATGKVQRTTLHEKLGATLRRTFEPPCNDFQRSIEAIFREVLGSAPVGIHDNFFALGGDSLRGTQVMVRVNRRHGVSLPVVELFRHPTVSGLAVAVERAGQSSAADVAALAAEIESMSDEEVSRLLGEAQPCELQTADAQKTAAAGIT